MRLSLLLVALLCCFRPSESLADGGTLQLMQQQGEYQISVFTSPSVLRVGPVDISVLLQHANSGKVINNADSQVKLVYREQPSLKTVAMATTAVATNKLLSAALIEIPEPGWWDVSVTCKLPEDESPVTVQLELNVAPALPDTLTFWPWFTWPVVPIVLFVVHRVIVARSIGRKKGLTTAPPRFPGQNSIEISATTNGEQKP